MARSGSSVPACASSRSTTATRASRNASTRRLPDPVTATLPAITCEHSQPGPTPDGGGVCTYTLDDLADDAVGVLDHYGVERAHVLGASMGGVVAQIIASRHAATASRG